METATRYSSNDSASSHNTGNSFSSGSGMYRNSNSHNEQLRVHNPSSQFGAQFGSEGENGNSESQYMGWQNLNPNSNSNWMPDAKPSGMGRSIHGANRIDTSNNKEDSMAIDNENSSFTGLLGATGGSDTFSDDKSKSGSNFSGGPSRPQHMPRMGLLGGGETPMVTPSATWSGNQGSNSSTWVNRPNNGDSNAVTPTKPPGSWAQAVGKCLSPGISGNSGQNLSDALPTETGPLSAREQEAHEFKLKAAYSQGWGQEGVNQDTSWDVDDPSNPDAPKEPPNPALWRQPNNNGTEVWENNLRMGKGNGVPVPPIPTTTAPPWGHTPATNIGGHWGDDDSSSSWNNGNPNTNSMPPPNWSDSNPTVWNGPSAPDNKHWNGGQNSCYDGSENWNNRNRQLQNWSPAATPKKEMPPSGWEQTSPPPVRRPVGSSYDDGTAVWGNPQNQGQRKVCHWKDMPAAKPIINSGNPMMANMPPGGPGMIRMPGGKNDGTLNWNKNRNSTWQDMPPHRDSQSVGTWPDDQMKNMGQGGQFNAANWNDQSNAMMYGSKPKSANWADGQVDTSSWLGPAKQGGKPLCKDIVYASKQFRVLTELGYRKEDVENALRNHNMSIEDAAAELAAISASGNMEIDAFGGRKVRPANMFDEMGMHDQGMDTFGQNNFHGSGNYPNSMNFSAMGHNFNKPPPKGPNAGSINSPIVGGNSNLSPALLQKLLQQQQQQQQQQQTLQMLNINNLQALNNPKLQSSANLHLLVKQIQTAVQNGHLNAQILNQTLTPASLQILYQLLQQIKNLNSLMQQHQSAVQLQKQGINNNNTILQLSLQIRQAKNYVSSLQSQISTHQALFIKQQQQAQHPQMPPPQQPPLQMPPNPQNAGDIFKPETMPPIHTDFRDLSIKDMTHNQSRLTQWKLSAMDKEDGDMNQGNLGDFSRAPGPLNSKPPNAHPLLEQNDGAWNNMAGRADSTWPEAVTSSTAPSNDGMNPATSAANCGPPGDGNATGAGSNYNLTDLVPEFEPGKPWKGTQIKNIEDDPHITPGSIARSPLSVNNIKDSNLFWPPKSSLANSGGETGGALSSNTWNYTPQASVGQASSKSGKGSWNNEYGNDSLGLSKSRSQSSAQGWENRQFNSNSTFLILRNLTPQIDGSTLKTLCMQHGPLQMFHLFLNRGVALVRYSSREEAVKAQSALDNCVLSNTTMLADFPNDTEIQQYLNSGGGAGNNSSGGNGGNTTSWSNGGNGNTNSTNAFYGAAPPPAAGNNGTANWGTNAPPATSQLWPFSNPSLWGNSSQEHDGGAANPISCLPNDLLGGEPI